MLDFVAEFQGYLATKKGLIRGEKDTEEPIHKIAAHITSRESPREEA